ncbi:pyruvate ferredoxin oxidoreductase gamma subunit [Jiangella mangrovi]|uniref:Pyruvate ferredoxin oxidoreductase gamma subunit n=1 Tax=Jiangella mangrovi TaxID=1524084 RepID=A0A7W9LM09_9ACTN|nr:pyruvate ferredoxin oxidoreductase gamma subunit [Jiangella mangrovi]
MTAAELLSVAAFAEGRHAQAFPSFGSERTGAPVVAFCRIADVAIRLREPVLSPDAIIVQDLTLFEAMDVFAGLKDGGYVLLNAPSGPAELGIGERLRRYLPGHVATVPASELAERHIGRPVPNAALLGAFAALTGVVSVDSVLAAIRGRFGDGLVEGNLAAAAEACDLVHAELGSRSHA